jgi:hypothetical protein
VSYTVHVALEATLTLECIETVIEMAGFGMTYWAASADWERSAERYTVRWEQTEGDPDSLTERTVTYQQIANAMARIATDDIEGLSAETAADVLTELRDTESEGAEIDSPDGDQILQVALFGKVVYG